MKLFAAIIRPLVPLRRAITSVVWEHVTRAQIRAENLKRLNNPRRLLR